MALNNFIWFQALERIKMLCFYIQRLKESQKKLYQIWILKKHQFTDLSKNYFITVNSNLTRTRALFFAVNGDLIPLSLFSKKNLRLYFVCCTFSIYKRFHLIYNIKNVNFYKSNGNKAS